MSIQDKMAQIVAEQKKEMIGELTRDMKQCYGESLAGLHKFPSKPCDPQFSLAPDNWCH